MIRHKALWAELQSSEAIRRSERRRLIAVWIFLSIFLIPLIPLAVVYLAVQLVVGTWILAEKNPRVARIRGDMVDSRCAKCYVGFFHLALNLVPLGLLCLGQELYWRLIAGLLAANNLLLALWVWQSERRSSNAIDGGST